MTSTEQKTSSTTDSTSQTTREQKPSSLFETLTNRFARLRQAHVGLGIMANQDAHNASMRWAERDNLAKHEVLYGERGKPKSQQDTNEEGADSMIPGMNLGDVFVQQPTQQAPPPQVVKQGLGIGATIALAMGSPLLAGALGLGGYLLAKSNEKPVPVAVQPGEGSLTLKHLSDFKGLGAPE